MEFKLLGIQEFLSSSANKWLMFEYFTESFVHLLKVSIGWGKDRVDHSESTSKDHIVCSLTGI